LEREREKEKRREEKRMSFAFFKVSLKRVEKREIEKNCKHPHRQRVRVHRRLREDAVCGREAQDSGGDHGEALVG